MTGPTRETRDGAPIGGSGSTMVADDRFWMTVDDVGMAGAVRRAATALGEEIGLGPARLADLAIVATEIATNLAKHADDGRVLVRTTRSGDHAGVQIIAIDSGPGMSDMGASARDGHSTSGTLGIGLGAIIRQATELDTYSAPSGTVVAAAVWDDDPPVPAWSSGISRPLSGEQVCGDAYATRQTATRRQIMLCDGLGHGPLAAAAAQTVVSLFAEAPDGGAEAVLAHIHGRSRHTRGVVAGIADLDSDRGVIRFAGLGNITAIVLTDNQRRAMVSLPGIVGQQGTIRVFEYPWSPASLVVLHSDGLTARWDLSAYPGLIACTPLVIAATLLREAGVRRDDASILVTRVPGESW